MTTVLKVGGSVITEKDREGTVDDAALGRVAAALAGAGSHRLVLVHGGGSFGHPAAERHGVSPAEGTADPAAIAEVHAAMLGLNGHVVDRCVDAGVPAVGVHPLSMARRSAGDLVLCLGPVRELLDAGFVPTLHGDGVVEGDAVTILSGDDLVLALASALGADRVGLCSATPGVLDADGAVIDRVRGYDAVADVLGGAEATDVTGGMAAKVRRLLERDGPSSIFGPGDLGAFLAGGSPGTTVDPR